MHPNSHSPDNRSALDGATELTVAQMAARADLILEELAGVVERMAEILRGGS